MKPPIQHTRARSAEAIQFARDQRATANEFAWTVWQWIRNRQVCRQKFRREYPIPPYTADFCCVELKLILEIDGADHLTETGKEHDRVRDQALADQGYRVVRIPGYDVLQEPRQVVTRIEACVRERMRELGISPSPPAPLPQGGEGSRISRALPVTGEESGPSVPSGSAWNHDRTQPETTRQGALKDRRPVARSDECRRPTTPLSAPHRTARR